MSVAHDLHSPTQGKGMPDFATRRMLELLARALPEGSVCSAISLLMSKLTQPALHQRPLLCAGRWRYGCATIAFSEYSVSVFVSDRRIRHAHLPHLLFQSPLLDWSAEDERKTEMDWTQAFRLAFVSTLTTCWSKH